MTSRKKAPQDDGLKLDQTAADTKADETTPSQSNADSANGDQADGDTSPQSETATSDTAVDVEDEAPTETKKISAALSAKGKGKAFIWHGPIEGVELRQGETVIYQGAFHPGQPVCLPETIINHPLVQNWIARKLLVEVKK